MRPALWASRCVRASTRASASLMERRCAGSPSTRVRGWRHSPGPARCSSPRPSRTSSRARGSSSKTGVSTSLRAYRENGGSMPSSEVRPLHVADTVHEGHTYPVYAYAVFHPDGLVLVDTGMIESHQEIEEYHPTLYPLTGQDVPLEEAKLVINTHLHFDHCGGNRLFPGTPIYVQKAEREAAREPDYT